MRPEQWEQIRAAAKGDPVARTPLALIIDSPWIPGWAGISHLDYYLDENAWFEANLRFAREFPEVIPLPSWWVEYGMAIEPSAFGTRLHFLPDQPPQQSPVLFRAEDISRFLPVNPATDGLMPWALQRYRRIVPRIVREGFVMPLVTARGPLCTAAFVRGVNEFLTDLVESPDDAHALLRGATEATVRWLEAQAEAIGPGVDGIFVLDDIPGLLSRRMYREFAHPYLQRICAAFPDSWVKVYHNDANIKPFLRDLPETGFDVLNFTHNLDMEEVRAATAGRLCLMGNVAPLEVGVRGTPAQVKEAAGRILERADAGRTILSLGGGVSPGMPAANIHALAEAVRARQA